MSTWYKAQAGIVETANIAMTEIANGGYDPDLAEKLMKVWQPVAEALLDSEPDFDDWPELAEQAKEQDTDYVGITSDTRQVVAWGEEHHCARDVSWREFVLLPRPDPK